MNLYINDMNIVKNTILKNVLAKVILNSCENVAINDSTIRITENVLDGLGINSRRIERGLESVDGSNVISTSIALAVDKAASGIMGKYSGKNFESEEEVYSAITKGYEAEETPNVLADTITEILNNAVMSMQTDIKTVSKMVLQLIKENQETEKEEKNEELEDFDNPEMEEKNEENKDGDDADVNPFDDKVEGDNSDNGDETTDDNKEGDEPKENGDKDDSKGDNSDDSKEPKEPEEKGKEPEGDLEENPFESMTAKNIDVIAKNWNNGYDVRAFEGLTCKDITNFSTFCAKEHIGEKLSKSYSAMQGMEDQEFNKNVKDFRNVARTYGSITVTTLLTLGKLGIKGNNNCIKYPQAYVED